MNKKLSLEKCRYFPNCTNVMCPFVHPTTVPGIVSAFGGGIIKSGQPQAGVDKKNLDCIHFKRGKCIKGDACEYRHSLVDPAAIKPWDQPPLQQAVAQDNGIQSNFAAKTVASTPTSLANDLEAQKQKALLLANLSKQNQAKPPQQAQPQSTPVEKLSIQELKKRAIEASQKSAAAQQAQQQPVQPLGQVINISQMKDPQQIMQLMQQQKQQQAVQKQKANPNMQTQQQKKQNQQIPQQQTSSDSTVRSVQSIQQPQSVQPQVQSQAQPQLHTVPQQNIIQLGQPAQPSVDLAAKQREAEAAKAKQEQELKKQQLIAQQEKIKQQQQEALLKQQQEDKLKHEQALALQKQQQEQAALKLDQDEHMKQSLIGKRSEPEADNLPTEQEQAPLKRQKLDSDAKTLPTEKVDQEMDDEDEQEYEANEESKEMPDQPKGEPLSIVVEVPTGPIKTSVQAYENNPECADQLMKFQDASEMEFYNQFKQATSLMVQKDSANTHVKSALQEFYKSGIIQEPPQFILLEPPPTLSLMSYTEFAYMVVSERAQKPPATETNPDADSSTKATETIQAEQPQPTSEVQAPSAHIEATQPEASQEPSIPVVQVEQQPAQAEKKPEQQESEPAQAQAKPNKMTREMLLKQIEDFNALLDRIEATLPFKVKYDPTEIEPDYEKLVSFETRVETLTEFFETKADDYAERIKQLLDKKGPDQQQS